MSKTSSFLDDAANEDAARLCAMVRACAERVGAFNRVERGFVENMSVMLKHGFAPTAKQVRWLRLLFAKTEQRRRGKGARARW